MLVFVLGLGAAALLGLGFVMQQRAAAQAPPEERLSPRILIDLARRPLWLGGIAAMVAGQLAGASALGEGDIALVEPLLATNLLFALFISARWSHRPLSRREWLGAAILVLGLTGFVVAGAPAGGSAASVPLVAWLISGAAIFGVAGVLTWLGRRVDPAAEATLLAAAAGMLFGLQDALTGRTVALLGNRGVVHVLTVWPPYAVIAVAITGLVLSQSAFEEAPLAASLPALTLAEPLTGIALGVGLFSETLRVGGIATGVEVVAMAMMVAGVIVVARSPLVTHAAGTPPPPGAGKR